MECSIVHLCNSDARAFHGEFYVAQSNTLRKPPPYISGAARVIQVNQALLNAARRAGINVIYLQMAFKQDLSDAGNASSPPYHKELALIMMRDRAELEGNCWSRIRGIGEL
jgi:nicotinamidase-related amidase